MVDAWAHSPLVVDAPSAVPVMIAEPRWRATSGSSHPAKGLILMASRMPDKPCGSKT